MYTRSVVTFTPDYATLLSSQANYTVFSQAGSTGRENWADQPTEPGSPAQPVDVLNAQPGRWIGDDNAPFLCAACREGNVFLPWLYMTSSDPSHASQGPVAGIYPSSVHLYQGTQEIPPTNNAFGFSEYTLSPSAAQYRLTMDQDNTHTVWNFNTAPPTTAQVPDGFSCYYNELLGGSGACAPVPLIFLRYDAGVDLNNAVTAPGSHQLTITAYHQDPKSPPITRLTVWISTDGGSTWQKANVEASGNGVYRAHYVVPALSGTTATVSIKTEARDAMGNEVAQTIINSYHLTNQSAAGRQTSK